jgi:hypothetical protein
MFAVAILILVIVALMYRSATQPLAELASAAMAFPGDLPVSRMESPQTEQRAQLRSGTRQQQPGSLRRRRRAS